MTLNLTTRMAVAVTLFATGIAQAQPRPYSPFLPPAKNPADPMQLPAMRQLMRDMYAPAGTANLPPYRVTPARVGLQPPPTELFDRPLAKARSQRVMDATRLPNERAVVLAWKKSFPKLGEDFEVLGEGTPHPTECGAKAGLDGKVSAGAVIPGTYNCIAHTGGIKNVWVNPYQTVEGWNLYYSPLGLKPTPGLDLSIEPGVQKVAVYATKTAAGKIDQYTHAAIQESDGTWTSKLGSGPLIRHRTALAVEGPVYGEVVRVYVKK
jgi:hypothetical protein